MRLFNSEHSLSLVIRGCAHLCNHIILVFFYFYSPLLKYFSLFFNWVVQVKVCIKGGKSSEIIYLGLIFLHHRNLLFQQGCVDFLCPLYIYTVYIRVNALTHIHFNGMYFINTRLTQRFCLTRGLACSWRNGDAQCCQLSDFFPPLQKVPSDKSLGFAQPLFSFWDSLVLPREVLLSQQSNLTCKYSRNHSTAIVFILCVFDFIRRRCDYHDFCADYHLGRESWLCRLM